MSYLKILGIIGASVLGLMFGSAGFARAPVFEFILDRAELHQNGGVERIYDIIKGQSQSYCKTLKLGTQQNVAECTRDVVENIIKQSQHTRLISHHVAEQQPNVLAPVAHMALAKH